jgi:hypothetical protein
MLGLRRSREPGDDIDPLAQRRETLEQRRQLQTCAFGRRPDLRADTVRHVDRTETQLPRGVRGRLRAQRRHHRIEEWQADRSTERTA